MSGFQVNWHGLRLDLQWGQVASETDRELRILQPDGGAWIFRDDEVKGLTVAYHPVPYDPLLDVGLPSANFPFDSTRGDGPSD